MKISPLETTTRAERLAGEIAASVLSGEFRPGLRLDENMLAKRYAVSRTPVREALRQLASTGLIDIKPRRGATVVRTSSAQHETMFKLVQQNDAEAFTSANLELHAQIYLGAHNDIIADFATGLRRRLAPFRRAQFRTEGRLSRSHEEHRQVVKAIVAGDAGAAHTAMFDHMSLVEESFERLAETI